MIAVVDYGAGNLFSVKNALTYIGVAHEITVDPARIAAADDRVENNLSARDTAKKIWEAHKA